ncbi:MAG TPA: TetR/AcrR family transcriptional regulator [Pseudonocardiaceae bacterium]|jgi:AcrR family transcriptional regulator|nr:TetR/AcrR family transcriptional regulator [Pseudonocardiaceae bacterium]
MDEAAPPATRLAQKRARRIELLERTAAQVFAAKGYDGANFDAIGAVLELRGPSLYHYFASKEELFLRCVRRPAEEVFARLRAIARRDLPAGQRLRALFHEQVLIEVRDYPEFVPLFFRTYVPIPELAATILGLRREHATIFEDVAGELADPAGAEKNDVRIRLAVAYGALGYLNEWYDPRGPIGPDDLADSLADLLVRPFLHD